MFCRKVLLKIIKRIILWKNQTVITYVYRPINIHYYIENAIIKINIIVLKVYK